MRWLSLLAVSLVCLACRGDAQLGLEQRLWVSTLPLKPRSEFAAVVIAEAKAGSFYGTFFRGSALRGHHDVFSWVRVGQRRARLTTLQDRVTTPVTIHDCRPSMGFDACVRLVGDPTGVERYQSRKRWRLPKRSNADAPLTIASTMQWITELAEEDPELARALVDDATP